jgi:hypothetical protein
MGAITAFLVDGLSWRMGFLPGGLVKLKPEGIHHGNRHIVG